MGFVLCGKVACLKIMWLYNFKIFFSFFLFLITAGSRAALASNSA